VIGTPTDGFLVFWAAYFLKEESFFELCCAARFRPCGRPLGHQDAKKEAKKLCFPWDVARTVPHTPEGERSFFGYFFSKKVTASF
jgi:hypothetical protein